MIIQAGFPCLDLLDPVEKKLDSYPQIDLQASAVNAHPGDILTEELSTEVLDYLKANHYLDKLPSIKTPGIGNK